MATAKLAAQIVILAATEKSLVVRATACDNCQTCSQGAGCRSRLFNLFGGSDRQFILKVPLGHSYKTGEVLQLSCPGSLPLWLSFTVYFVPLLIFAVLTAVGSLYLASELSLVSLALGGVFSYYAVLYLVKPMFIWQRLLEFNLEKLH